MWINQWTITVYVMYRTCTIITVLVQGVQYLPMHHLFSLLLLHLGLMQFLHSPESLIQDARLLVDYHVRTGWTTMLKHELLQDYYPLSNVRSINPI